MHPIPLIRMTKNIAFYIVNLALVAFSLGAWSAKYMAIEIDHHQVSSNQTLFFIYKIGVIRTGQQYIYLTDTDYKTCAAISNETLSWFDLATNGIYAYKAITFIEYFFDLVVIIPSARALINLKQTTGRFYKLLFWPSYFLLDSINGSITRCVIIADSVLVKIALYVVFSKTLIFFVALAVFGKVYSFDRVTSIFFKFFALYSYSAFFYMILCIPVSVLHCSWIAIFISVNVVIDIASDVVLDWYEPKLFIEKKCEYHFLGQI